MVAVLLLSAVAGGVVTLATPVSADQHQASVTFTETTAGGSTVTVDEVTLPEGGFLTIHDDTLTDGETLGSVVGTSSYLDAGTHENVTVHLDEQISGGTFHAMAHRDTDSDRAYTFVSSNGGADGPYTAGGDIVMDSTDVTVSASVTVTEQTTDGTTLVVDRVELSEGGFVTVHDASILDGAVFESIRGTSAYLEAGVHENVRIELDGEVTDETTLVPMAHKDTNDNQVYDFPDTEGEEDGPFVTAQGEAVVDTAQVTPSEEASATFSAQASGGTTVVVDEVFLPEGGFVTMHDSSLADGAVFESIRGTSEYLSPGLHRNVVVTLEEPLEDDDTLFAMAHQDTNDNQAYDFPDTEGDADGPYTTDGDIVMDDGNVTLAAQVNIDTQTSDGTTLVVDRVDLSEGGFVTIHDASLKDGAVFESIRGTSEYLEAGVHEDVTVELDEPLAETNQVLAMAHQDTNDNQAYDFPDSEGEADGPYTANGNIVMQEGTVRVTAMVSADTDRSDGETVVIERVTLHNGGFVTVHDSTLLDGAVFESIRGTSDYLSPGTHEDVEITLDEPLEDDDTLFSMAHQDTNNNQAYDFPDSEGQADGPYAAAGGPVMDGIDVMAVADEDTDDSSGEDTDDSEDGDMGNSDGEDTDDSDDEMDSSDDENMNDSEDGMDESSDGETTETESGDGSGAGFGVLVALIALLGSGLFIARRRS
jgi:PGF-CTERM protein